MRVVVVVVGIMSRRVILHTRRRISCHTYRYKYVYCYYALYQ